MHVHDHVRGPQSPQAMKYKHRKRESEDAPPEYSGLPLPKARRLNGRSKKTGAVDRKKHLADGIVNLEPYFDWGIGIRNL